MLNWAQTKAGWLTIGIYSALMPLVVHHQLVASARAIKYAHENHPNFKLGNIICFWPYYPYTCNPDDVLKAQQYMQMSQLVLF